jgi:colicin import membrane protein
MVLHFQPFEDTEFDRNFWRMFWVSLVLHVMVILGVAYSRRLVPPPVYYTPPSYTVDLVTVERPKPVHRPVHKAVPKKPAPPKAKPEKKIPIPTKTEKKATPPPKEVAKKTEKKSPPKPPAKEYSEKEIRSSISDLKKRVEAKRAAEQDAVEARGRITSRIMEIRFKAYYNTIWEIIRDAWVIPEGVHVQPGLETIVGIRIAKDGRVLQINIESASGNEPFDQSAIRAIEKSSPLPPLPGEEETMEVGIRFTPEEIQ